MLSKELANFAKSAGTDRLRQAGRAGLAGATAGAGLGALRAGFSRGKDKGYLRNTLAGALLGGLGAGGASYIASADPFTQGSAPVKSFEAARKRYMDTMMSEPTATPGEAGRDALQTGLLEYLSGKHEFTPDEQKSLTSQFVKSRVPTGAGWRKRVNLLQRSVTGLRAQPRSSRRHLTLLQKVAPDPETRMLAGEALARLRSGAAGTPEGQHALATLAQAIHGKLSGYRRATGVLDALNVMKERYGKGTLDDEGVAKNIGLITGRFGPKTPQAEATRRLVQQILANPIKRHPKSPYSQAAGSPGINSLIERAMAG